MWFRRTVCDRQISKRAYYCRYLDTTTYRSSYYCYTPIYVSSLSQYFSKEQWYSWKFWLSSWSSITSSLSLPAPSVSVFVRLY